MTQGPIPDIDTSLREQAILNRVYDSATNTIKTSSSSQAPTEYPLPTSQVTTLTPPPAITGYATSAKQDSQITLETQLETLVDTLQELIQRLAPLAGAMNNTAQLRTVVTGAVTATGGGYVTSAQVIAALLTQTTSLRPPLDNNLAIQSNINNAVGV